MTIMKAVTLTMRLKCYSIKQFNHADRWKQMYLKGNVLLFQGPLGTK